MFKPSAAPFRAKLAATIFPFIRKRTSYFILPFYYLFYFSIDALLIDSFHLLSYLLIIINFSMNEPNQKKGQLACTKRDYKNKVKTPTYLQNIHTKYLHNIF